MMEWIIAHWEYILLGIMIIDKVVALSPTKQDDLIWTSIKGVIMTLAPKKRGSP